MGGFDYPARSRDKMIGFDCAGGGTVQAGYCGLTDRIPGTTPGARFIGPSIVCVCLALRREDCRWGV
jgi:hypothetical protein